MDQLVMDKPLETKIPDPAGIHIPVMLQETVDYLSPPADGIFVDGTLGLAGHASVFLSLLSSQGRLIGIDRDAQALALAQKRLKDSSDRCIFVHDNFSNIDAILDDLKIEKVDRILLDLGLSSFQMDNPHRGFSLRAEGPLDMRMDPDGQITAYDLINSLSERELDTILKDFGQERWHYQIARRLVQERSQHPIENIRALRHIVMRAIPYRRKRQKIHPATRTFQAFRIAVNQELDALAKTLDKCVARLKKEGRLGVISFHSLEDKIVKEKFKSYAKDDVFRLPFKKPLRPKFDETKTNRRARSARFRVAEKIV